MTKLLNELAAKQSRCRQCGASDEYLKSDNKTIEGLWHSFTCIRCGAQCLLSELAFATQRGGEDQ